MILYGEISAMEVVLMRFRLAILNLTFPRVQAVFGLSPVGLQVQSTLSNQTFPYVYNSMLM
jgi:hypothetical protein